MAIQGTLTINTRERGAAMGDLFGIFFEDLNHAADGGLYAELIQNRSFEFDPIDHPDYHALYAWDKVERGGGRGEVRIEKGHPLHPRNEHYVVIEVMKAGEVGIMNLGYNSGIPLKAGETYLFSMFARQEDGTGLKVRVAIEGVEGNTYAETAIAVVSEHWSKYEARLTAPATDFSGRLVVTIDGCGKIYLDMISLFPSRVFRNRNNGLREDIATLIAELKPKFMRFPGGCLIHDGSLDANARNSMYRWKNTIGGVETRPARRSNWRYNQTLGLGYYEYFLFCEDIGAKPIPIIPAGYDPHHKRVVPIEELQPWIDDALDLIEFANGDATTCWGAVRSSLGHPEPFNLEYIGIGNEEVGELFFERYAYFHRAIKDRYPGVKVINSSGPFAAGSEYDRGWKSARENQSDFVDEHYYQSPEWMLANYRRYDSFSKEDPHVFLGEYASWGNTYYNALAEAAFMTGLERNAHAVGLACYAPMLCNVDYINWKPDMIWFNNHQVFGTANYYVQKLFMHNQGDYVLQVSAEGFNPPVHKEIRPISGKLAVGTDQCSVEFSRILLHDHETAQWKYLCEENIYLDDTEEAREIGSARRMFELGAVESRHYTLSMKVKKISGRAGFLVHFGWSDESNHIQWEIGGWQNQDSMINAFVNGRSSILTQSLFTVENDVEYDLVLEVYNRCIRAYIDGILINDTEDRLPVIEPLYYSSSLDEATGDVILKVVNIQDVDVISEVNLGGMESRSLTVEVAELSGHSPEEENSFLEPERIVPIHRQLNSPVSHFEYVFKGQSITVLRMKKQPLYSEGTK